MNISDSIYKNFNKSNWNRYNFSDFAENIVEKIIPRESGLEHYIGLEHLDSGSLKINRFGDPQSLKGDKLKICKGDIIFAKRNAYLKRASLVGFDAVASAHSMVLRAKTDIVLPEFLPFFMQSDSFWDVAIRISVGGLSPTINWKAMAKQEFLLPPKDQQEKIAELLWSMDDVIERAGKLAESIVKTKRSFFKPYRTSSKYKSLLDFSSVSYGFGQPPAKDENGVAMIRATDISRGRIDMDNFLRISENGIPKEKKVQLAEGDLIIVRSGAYTGDLAMITKECEGAVAGYDLVIRPDRNLINPIWLQEYLLEKEAQNYFKGESIRSAQPHLNSKQVLETPIPVLSFEIQNEVSEKLYQFHDNLLACENRILNSKQLQNSLINEIFSS